MEPNENNNGMGYFGFDDNHFLEDSRPSTSIFPYSKLEVVPQNQNNILPWNEDRLKNKISRETRRKVHSMSRKEKERLSIMTKKQIQKRKNKEDKINSFKMNNNFLEFRVVYSSKGKRRTKDSCQNETFFHENRLNQILINRKKAENALKNRNKDIGVEKNPKIIFLERKFKLKSNTYTPDSRKKSLNFSTIHPDIELDPPSDSSIPYSVPKSSKRYNIFRPSLTIPLKREPQIYQMNF